MKIATRQIHPRKDQPRQRFDQIALQELADSIKENGLLQAITVRRITPRRDARGRFIGAANAEYEIVVGERRWRAHELAGLEFIECNIVSADADDNTLAIDAIVENIQRADITPLEEARAFQHMIDRGFTCATLAQRLGIKQPHRISDRLQLLRLRPEYVALLECRSLTPSQAFEMSRLDASAQPALFEMICAGRCNTYTKLRAAADGILAAAQQRSMFAPPHAPTEAEQVTLSKFETMVNRLVDLCNEGIKDNEIVAVKKVDPSRASTMVLQIGLIRTSLGHIEKALHHAAAQGAQL